MHAWKCACVANRSSQARKAERSGVQSKHVKLYALAVDLDEQ